MLIIEHTVVFIMAAQILAPTSYVDSGFITSNNLGLCFFLSAMIVCFMAVQWYIRNPRYRIPSVMGCGCCTQVQPLSYGKAGFHHREGAKLHYELLLPSNTKHPKGTIIFLHGLLRSVIDQKMFVFH
jgi:hypothetical protein